MRDSTSHTQAKRRIRGTRPEGTGLVPRGGLVPSVDFGSERFLKTKRRILGTTSLGTRSDAVSSDAVSSDAVSSDAVSSDAEPNREVMSGSFAGSFGQEPNGIGPNVHRF